MLDHGNVERAAIVHDLTREFCGGDGFAVVGNGDDAGFFHGGDFGDGFAFAADAGGADGPDANAGGGFGAIENEARDAGVVVDGFGVGHAADGGESAARCGRVPVSMVSEDSWPGSRRCACMIDEAGGDDQAGGVEDFGVVVIGREFSGRGDFGDFFAVEKNVRGRRRFSMRGRGRGRF